MSIVSKFKWIGISLAVIIILGFTSLQVYISLSVNKYVSIAVDKFPDEKGKIFSMINFVKSKDYPLSEKNNMIWAIGRLSDKKALSYLQSIYTGNPCNHSENLCQYEISKAINRCGGKTDFKYKDKKFNL